MEIALAGIGEVAIQQHVPAIESSDDWALVATCSRNGSLPGIPAFTSIEEMLAAKPNIAVVSLCHPPKPRFAFAETALRSGKHVMLEKPPGTTVSECLALHQVARANHVTLFTTWHSQQADMVETARQWLADKHIVEASITWREDVRRWHAGQQWIWQQGGYGVLDPGINALSIITRLLPGQLYPVSARFLVPENKCTPIAADIELGYVDGAVVAANFDWREQGEQQWDICITTNNGKLTLMNGGATLLIDDKPVRNTDAFVTLSTDQATNTLGNEYRRLYQRMAELIAVQQCDVDLAPLQLVADCFLIAEIINADPFIE